MYAHMCALCAHARTRTRMCIVCTRADTHVVRHHIAGFFKLQSCDRILTVSKTLNCETQFSLAVKHIVNRLLQPMWCGHKISICGALGEISVRNKLVGSLLGPDC